MTNVQSVSPTESHERQGQEVKRQACKCELCGVEMGGEEEGDGQAEGQEEGQAAKSLPQPRMPSRKIVEEHELTHISYRSWCVHCRRARGIAAPHRSSAEETKEEKEGAISSWSMDYTFLTEDFELLTRTEAEEHAYKDKIKDTVLVSADRKTGGIKAHLVQCKGLGDKWIAAKTVEDLNEFGYNGVDICIKTDQEPAILELQKKVAELRSKARTIPVNSPVGDSKSNGRVENAIRRVQSMIRTLRSGLEAKLGVKIGRGHALYPWLIEWAADLITRYKVNTEGRTAVQEVRGSKSARAIAEFGEKIMYMPGQTTSGKLGKLDDRYRDGIFLGMRLRSDEILVGTKDGVVKARSVCRHADQSQWDNEMAKQFRGTPRQPVPGIESDHVPATLGRKKVEDADTGEAIVEEDPEEEKGEQERTQMAPEAPVRGMYISKKLIEKHGKTEGCPGCKAIGIRRSVTHSEECRQRIRKMMESNEEGRAGLAKEEQRQEAHFQEAVERQVQADDELMGEQHKHEEEVERLTQPKPRQNVQHGGSVASGLSRKKESGRCYGHECGRRNRGHGRASRHTECC